MTGKPLACILAGLLLAGSVIMPSLAGDGSGQQNSGSKGDCGQELALYQDEQKLWQRDADQLAAMPGSRLLNEGRKNEAKGIELRLLLPAENTIRSVTIIACRGKTQNLSVADLHRSGVQYYLVPNRRGDFKLVAIHRQGGGKSLLKRVVRVVLHSTAPNEKQD